jgi:hypothetical protein
MHVTVRTQEVLIQNKLKLKLELNCILARCMINWSTFCVGPGP